MEQEEKMGAAHEALPEAFKERMSQMLGEEYPQFLASYETEKRQAIRLNPQKTTREDFLEKKTFSLREIPWSRYGFVYDSAERPGKHPYHEAGVYYIQEPSAQFVAELVEAKPGECILDLCAAPGGKSTQMAADMQGKGLFVCNEIHPARAKILSENIERMGITNGLVLNETPERLVPRLGSFFDKILVDAPCSGEGMFRKNEEANGEWSEENVALCATRQDGILDAAANMLKPGGRLVYSTCTFAPAENEGSIKRFLDRHPEFTLVPIEKKYGIAEGIGLPETARLWPHKLEGEGHFVAVLRKQGEERETALPGNLQQEEILQQKEKRGGAKSRQKEAFGPWIAFCKEYLGDWGEEAADNRLLLFGDQLYLTPVGMPDLKALKVLRPGLHLGTMKKERFEPGHALALSLSKNQVKYTYDLSIEEAKEYLGGATFRDDGEKGWYLITVDGYSLGWGKLAGGVMKNHYPKGLRKNYGKD